MKAVLNDGRDSIRVYGWISSADVLINFWFTRILCYNGSSSGISGLSGELK